MISNLNIWNAIDDPILGFTNHISEMIKKHEKSNIICLPDLRNTKDLFVFSDYSGEHKESKYDVYSFLLCDLSNSLCFLNKRAQIRLSTLKNRKISFKDFNDKIRLNAINRFLDASNSITGIVCTIAIDKDVDHFFDLNEINYLKSIYPEFEKWKRKTLEKLLRIIHFINLFIAGLSCPKQNICWFTDEDDILINIEKHYSATNLFAFLSGLYIKSEMGNFKLGSTKYDPGTMEIEDLCSIPDLVSGALCDFFNYYKTNGLKLNSNFSYGISDSLSFKTKKILNWLSDEKAEKPLKRFSMIIERTDENKLDFRILNLFGKHELLIE